MAKHTLPTRILVILGILQSSWCLICAAADVRATIAAIERLPRSKRLAAYPAAMVATGVSDADRVALIREFARHANCVSPFYGQGAFPFDEHRWISILNHGFKADPADAQVARALCRMLIDQRGRRFWQWRPAEPRLHRGTVRAHPLSCETNLQTTGTLQVRNAG